MAAASTSDPGSSQVSINNEFWREHSDLVEWYATRDLRAPEAVILVRYAPNLSGKVLELGCGGGRITGHLLALGAKVHGLDISPAMVEYCRKTYPEGTFEVRDLRDLGGVGAGYDAVVAGFNVLDVLDDAERREVLAAVRGLLAPGGVIVMSSHNRAHAPKIPSPLQLVFAEDAREALRRAVRLPKILLNRRRSRRLEREEPGYAVLANGPGDYELLHYHIDRDVQERQFAELGYVLLECVDEEGRVVPPGETAPEHSELHYVARRVD